MIYVVFLCNYNFDWNPLSQVYWAFNIWETDLQKHLETDSVTIHDLLTEMKGTMISNFSTYLLVERMGLSTPTLWWYLLLPTSSSNSFASAALPPSNERPPSALAAVSKASWEKRQQIRCLASSLFFCFLEKHSLHFSTFPWKDVTMQKNYDRKWKKTCLSACIGQDQISSAEKQRKEASQTPETMQHITSNNS